VGLAGGAALLLWSLPAMYAVGSKEMLDSLRVTVWYSVGTVPVQLAAGLVLAVLINQRIPGRQAFRVVYLLPYVVPSVASAAVFERLFSLRPESLANQVMKLVGLPEQQWLQEASGIFSLFSGGRIPLESANPLAAYWLTWAQGPSLALVSIMFFSWWVFVGYYALIYTNGLSNIPRQLYEAAEVDGASKVTSFLHITIPLLSPTTYFLTLLGVIGTFKAFNHLYVLRTPAARGTVDAQSIYIFFEFFRKQRFGYAAALSLVLFAIVIGLTVMQRRISERSVHYGD
jgi:multiple sugar transport system permease protein